jgi:hypothetical protein
MRPRGRWAASAQTWASERMHPNVLVDAVFTALADDKNPSAGKTASAG